MLQDDSSFHKIQNMHTNTQNFLKYFLTLPPFINWPLLQPLNWACSFKYLCIFLSLYCFSSNNESWTIILPPTSFFISEYDLISECVCESVCESVSDAACESDYQSACFLSVSVSDNMSVSLYHSLSFGWYVSHYICESFCESAN